MRPWRLFFVCPVVRALWHVLWPPEVERTAVVIDAMPVTLDDLAVLEAARLRAVFAHAETERQCCDALVLYSRAFRVMEGPGPQYWLPL